MPMLSDPPARDKNCCIKASSSACMHSEVKNRWALLCVCVCAAHVQFIDFLRWCVYSLYIVMALCRVGIVNFLKQPFQLTGNYQFQ